MKEFIEFLLHRRSKAHSVALSIGINHAIVFNSACYLEGILETSLKALLRRRREIFNKIDMPDFEVRKTTNTLFRALEEDLENRISRSTGISVYEQIIELLTNKKISQNEDIKELWEGIQVLFQFRNVLAHGREVSARRISAYYIKEPWKENFSGGYKRAEDYLTKVGLLDQSFMDSDKLDLFFTDPIADHFWELASKFVERCINSFIIEDKKVVDEALSIGINEAKNGNAEQSASGDAKKLRP